VGDPSGFLPKSRRRAARYARLALTLVAALSAARRRGRAVVALTLCYGDHLPARTRRLYRNAIRRTYFGYGDAHDCTGSRPTPGPRGYSAGRRPLNGYPVTVQDDVPAIPASGTAANKRMRRGTHSALRGGGGRDSRLPLNHAVCRSTTHVDGRSRIRTCVGRANGFTARLL
jgi:hypothetical protein